LQKTIVVDDLGERPVTAWQEGAQDGLGQLVEGVEDDAQTKSGEERPPDVTVDELKGQVEKDVGERHPRAVDVGQRVADPQADQHHANQQEDQPPFDVEAGGEPAHHPGVHSYTGHRRPKLSTAFFELPRAPFRYIHSADCP